MSLNIAVALVAEASGVSGAPLLSTFSEPRLEEKE
jgi:hypothetical protein